MICWRYMDEEPKISAKHFFRSIKSKTQKNGKKAQNTAKCEAYGYFTDSQWLVYDCFVAFYPNVKIQTKTRYETDNNYRSEWCRKGHCGSDAV